jgi:hypothetical protein
MKASREKCQITCKGNPIRIIADLSAEALMFRRAQTDVFPKGKCQPRLLYPANLSFKFEDIINIFHDKHKLKKLKTTKHYLRVKGILHIKRKKNIHKHEHLK